MKLLIEDEQPAVTEGLRHGVNWTQLGFETVVCANSVSEARDSLQVRPADVMICDIEMPGESGLNLLK